MRLSINSYTNTNILSHNDTPTSQKSITLLFLSWFLMDVFGVPQGCLLGSMFFLIHVHDVRTKTSINVELRSRGVRARWYCNRVWLNGTTNASHSWCGNESKKIWITTSLGCGKGVFVPFLKAFTMTVANIWRCYLGVLFGLSLGSLNFICLFFSQR